MKGAPILVLIVYVGSINALKTFSIVHFNDFHARYGPVTNLSAPCEGPQCIGGFSRLYYEINNLVESRPNPIVLNSGDNFVGTLWYMTYGWNITQYFINKLPLDAISIGNHEFDDGVETLISYLKSLKAPVVCANIDASQIPNFARLYNRSVIIQKGGKKIGVIGVILQETNKLSKTGKLLFLNESHSVNTEAAKLLHDEKVFTNIVLSHCGYEADLELARNSTSKISVIIGGHTDTFLYTGSPSPGPDKPLGPYPTIVTNIHDGSKVLVVQASAYTKYLGNLTVVYDDDGNLIEWSGNPIFLDGQIPQDETINQDLSVWKKEVDKIGAHVVGSTVKTLPNKPCRSAECPLGNFVTDAMVYYHTQDAENDTWTYASIAMFHAGGMRSGVEIGNVTMNELASTFPFQDTIDCMEFKGKHIEEILEKSMDDKHLKNPHLYQVSGIQVVFNISKPEGQRVQSLKVSCQKCTKPIFENLRAETFYRVLLPKFLTSTQFNPLFIKYAKRIEIGPTDLDVYVNYLRDKSPINPVIERRIQIIT